MPDITTTMTVRRLQLENLRDVLRERSEHAEDWRGRVAAQAHEEITADQPDELIDFLLELSGDLDDWARTLSGIIGDD
ncbi:MAG: hypothetical protein ABL907_23665 [Hyphomicrobium sp.]